MKLVHASTVMASAVGDSEVVMMDVDLARYFGLSATGPAVWAEFEAPSDVEEVIARLEQRFDAPSDVIATDVRQLVDGLVERKLLVPAAD